MEFTPREKQILLVMLEKNNIMYVRDIAEKLNISGRTVMREFELLKPKLMQYGISLMKKQGQGIWLQGIQPDMSLLKKKLQQMNAPDYSDKDTRRKCLICELLRNNEPQKLYHFSRIFGVSEATISSDLDAVRQWLEEKNIKLVRRHSYGIWAEGPEIDIRKAVRRLISDCMDKAPLSEPSFKNNMVMDCSIEPGKGCHNIYDILDFSLLKQVLQVIQSIQDQKLLGMTDISYREFVYYIFIAANRMLDGHYIKADPEVITAVYNEGDFNLANRIALALGNKLHMEIPKDEQYFFMLEICGSKLQQARYTIKMDGRYCSDEVLSLADSMIDAFDSETGYAFKYDEEFMMAFICHIQPTIIRLKSDMPIFNPIVDDIKKQFPDVFRKSARAAEVLEKYTGKIVNDHEIAYLTVHFQAALERFNASENMPRIVNVGIICESGIGIARLMRAKLENYLKKSANLYTFGYKDINNELRSSIDFYVSSISLDNIGVDYVKVNPLLSEDDYKHIQLKVKQYSKTPRKLKRPSYVENYKTINYITEQTRLIIDGFKVFNIDAGIDFDELVRYVSNMIGDNADRAMMLYNDLQAREKLMSQIFVEQQFALLHCITKGVDNNCFYVCNPEGSDHFMHPYMKKIRSVIVMLMPDNKYSTISGKMLGAISSSFISDRAFMIKIFEGNELEITHCLGEILNDYIRRFLEQ